MDSTMQALYPALTVGICAFAFSKGSSRQNYIGVGWLFRQHGIHKHRKNRGLKNIISYFAVSISIENQDALNISFLNTLNNSNGIFPLF